jgi:hypothetical protein
MSTRNLLVGAAAAIVIVTGAGWWWSAGASDATAMTSPTLPAPTGSFGADEEVIGPDDVSNLDIDAAAVSAALESVGADVVMTWSAGRDAESVMVVALGNDVSEPDLRGALATATPHADRFTFVEARYSTDQLDGFASLARTELADVGNGNGVVSSQLQLDTLLGTGEYGTLNAQPALWIFVDPEDEAAARTALEKVVPADSFILDPIGVPGEWDEAGQ